MQNRLVV